MKISYRLAMAFGLVAISLTAGAMLARGNLTTSTPNLKTLGVEIDLIPLLGVANPPSPYDTIGGATYTSVVLRSMQTYSYQLVFNPEGKIQKVDRATLWAMSGDCPGCPLSLVFTYTINGVGNLGTMQFPGRSLQGPVTNEVSVANNSTLAILSGLNSITFQPNLEIYSTYQTTNFIIGFYKIALFVQYSTID